MRRRRLLLGLGSLALFGLIATVLLTALWFWPQTDPARECFDRIDVGMPFVQAEDILTAYGFKCTGGGVESGEATLLYTREGAEGARIGLIVERDGLVHNKEFDEGPPPDSLLTRLRRLLPW